MQSTRQRKMMMLRKLWMAALIAAPALVWAQQADTAPTEAPKDEPSVRAVSAILGVMIDKEDGGTSLSEFCRVNSTTKLPSNGVVVVVRKVPCTGRYSSSGKTFLEVLFGGKTLLVPFESVLMTDAGQKELDGLSQAQIEASADEWKLRSLQMRQMQLESAVAAVNATSKQGVALLKASIFDVSEHTEGTGFSVRVLNTGRKTIKYVTFSVVGLNAVKDPVRGGYGGSTTAVLRGIGPIGPDETGGYSKDYMWMTDIVESFRISQIKLEFTDGTSRVVTDMKAIRISEKDVAQLEADTD